MASWHDLPAEIRQKIWRMVAGPDEKFTHEDFRGPNKADYAVVNREWSEYWEKRTFAELCVYNHQIENFHQVIKNRPERLKHVRRLQYTIDLPHYHGFAKDSDEDQETIEINNIVFSHSMMMLVRTLSLWQPPSSEIDSTRRDCQMQLELGVRSYSDAKSYLKQVRTLDPHGPVRTKSANCELCSWMGKGISELFYPFGVYLPPPPAVRRVFGGRLLTLVDNGRPDILALTNPASETEAKTHGKSLKLQAAPIVRKLAASRNFFRCIHPKVYAHMIQHFFPRVESVKLEPWRPLDEVNYKGLEDGFVEMLDTLPPKMHTLSVFIEKQVVTHPEVFLEIVSGRFPGNHPVLGLGPRLEYLGRRFNPELDTGQTRWDLDNRMPRDHVAEGLARYMHASEIENVCAYGFAEAAVLFREVQKSGTCPKLKTLVVSSGVNFAGNSSLNRSRDDDFWDLVAQAARAVKLMPCLERLAIVSAHPRELWRFTVTTGLEKGQKLGDPLCTTLCLEAKSRTPNLMEADVRSAWANATWEGDHQTLRVSYIDRSEIYFTGPLLDANSLLHSFLLPRSVMNMKMQNIVKNHREHVPTPASQSDVQGGESNKSIKASRKGKKQEKSRGTDHHHRSDKARWHNCLGCGKKKCVAAMGGPCRFGKDNSIKALIYELRPQQRGDDKVAKRQRRQWWGEAFRTSYGISRQLGHWDTYDNTESYNTKLPRHKFFRAWRSNTYGV